MKTLKLKDVIFQPISGEWGSDGDKIKVIRTTNFTNEGKLDLQKVVLRNIEQKLIKLKKLQKGDIIIEKSGGSPTQPVGRVVYFNEEGEYLCNNFTSVLRSNPSIINSRYLFFKLFLNHKIGSTRNFQNKTTGIINLKLDRYIEKTEIPLPPLPTQKKIAAILDKVQALCELEKQIIQKYDQLAQSVFLEMFGDPVTNAKNWIHKKFEDLVAKDCQLSYGIVQPGDEVKNGIPCVRPIDLTEQYLKTQDLKRIDQSISHKFKRTILNGGEILLSVRGSIGLLSITDASFKGCNVTRGIVPIWFESEKYNKMFFYYLYTSYGIQNQLKGLAKGATLLQINLEDLRELKVIQPPIELQNHFAERVKKIEYQKQISQQSLKKSEELFQCLLQKAFMGELMPY